MVLFFGAVLPRYDVEFKDVVDLAVELEGLGFRSLWVTDHLQPGRASRVLESWTLLTALAPATDVRLGTSVLCTCYRHPALLAKMAATLDVVSYGRLELGVGAGSEPQENELKSLGMSSVDPSSRVEHLREYVEVLRLLLTGVGQVNFSGKFYRLSSALPNTPPYQKPTFPIWVGARRPRMVRLAAEIGDGWNFYGETVEEYMNVLKVFEERCRALGRNPSRSVFTNVVVYRNADEQRERLQKLGSYPTVEEALRKTFTLLHGSPDQVVKQVETMASNGVGLIILRDMDVKASSLKLFAEEVMPSFNP
jgi:alkanesulfonate monooxygenase SsuD/methylene tetrahydromethanopterin reductase-like flavin-dependent oxidoreductase (luciferase family)